MAMILDARVIANVYAYHVRVYICVCLSLSRYTCGVNFVGENGLDS